MGKRKYLAFVFLALLFLITVLDVTYASAENSLPSAMENAEQAELANADQLIQEAFVLYQQAKYKEAMPLAQRALEIKKRILGEEHLDYADCLEIVADLYEKLGEPAQARSLIG